VEVNPILIDTNAYAAFKQGNADAVATMQRTPAIALNTIVVGELLAGFASGSREDANPRELARFLDSPRVVVLPVDRGTAERYAEIYSGLKKAATPIPANDMWIAASALQHNLLLYTFDQHFHAVAGLRTGKSLSELERASRAT
jgi:tRNA(fMet)-specific endonuclease VapC